MSRYTKIMEKVAGAGLSDEQLYRRIRSGLLSTVRDISRKFADTNLKYSNSELNGTVAGHQIRIYYEVLRASNGETAGLPVLFVDGNKYARFYRNVVDKLTELIGTPVVASEGRSRNAGNMEAYEKLLGYVKDGAAVLTAQDIHKDVPTIHNFAGKYHDSVDHLGYGMFKGKTEHGEFTFDAGGAMNRTGDVSWTILSADKQVLHDLKYDIGRVERALQELIAGSKVASVAVGAREFKGSFKPMTIIVELGGQQGHYIVDGGFRAYSARELAGTIAKAFEKKFNLQNAGLFGPEYQGVEIDVPTDSFIENMLSMVHLSAKGDRVMVVFDPNTDRFTSKIASSKVAFTKTNFDTAEEYVEFLTGTLIPDLKESGKIETAKDFTKIVNLVKSGRKDFSFTGWLKATLIPDLRDDGLDATADDLEEGIYWIQQGGR